MGSTQNKHPETVEELYIEKWFAHNTWELIQIDSTFYLIIIMVNLNSLTRTSSEARATLQANGFPPNVEPC